MRTQITCPNCASQIDVNEILKHQLEESIRNEFKKDTADLIRKQKEKEIALAEEKKEFEKTKANEEVLFQERLDQERKAAEEVIERKLMKKLSSENEDRVNAMQKELFEKSEKLKELFKKEAQIEQLKREKNEAEEQAKLNAQKELSKQLQLEKEKIKRQAEES